MLLSDHQGQIHGNKQATCFSPLVVALLLTFHFLFFLLFFRPASLLYIPSKLAILGCRPCQINLGSSSFALSITSRNICLSIIFFFKKIFYPLICLFHWISFFLLCCVDVFNTQFRLNFFKS